ncbi:helix-turn-helix domain-containing protein [[Clostridium] colinum]|uniref:helix-turn-helix domain-containing protein n=1 Tax=[Clostridium] colinum TaxID=36835 RepID=UPI0020252FFE|nr:helix-turn-helix transcriptional regulator [[Clostridium] colinum]
MARINNVAFQNLRAEMARNQVTIKEMSDYLGISRDTLANKLSMRRQINLDEALLLSRKFFPDSTLNYLFEELDSSVAKTS